MALSREQAQAELDGSKAALQAHLNGVETHKIVVKAFEDYIKTLPVENKEKLKTKLKELKDQRRSK